MVRFQLLNQDVLRIIAEFAFDQHHAAVVGMLDHNLLQSFLQYSHYQLERNMQQVTIHLLSLIVTETVNLLTF